MPYGNLEQQVAQRFASRTDLAAANCTIEEREEYEPHIAAGTIVYAGVDYAKVLNLAEQESDLILWDGGNNDFPFIHPDLHIVLVDPLRPGDETTHHPGEVVLRMADIVVVAKVDAAATVAIQCVTEAARSLNPTATIVRAASPIRLADPEAVQGRSVLVVEDGPTTTHGRMAYGAGYVAATRAHALEIVNPRPFAVPAIAEVYAHYPHLHSVLPAMGYSTEQLKALQETINNTPADVVVSATPIDLESLITLNKPIVWAYYEFAEASEPGLATQVQAFLARIGMH